MPVIALLRHGQASFGTDDYDRLSDLGRRQAEVAGAELGQRGLRSPVVVSGSLLRQRDTAAIAAEALGVRPSRIDERFDEFDAHAAVEAHLGRPGATEGMDSREFQVHLDEAMALWMAEGDPRWRDFVDGALAGLTDLAASLPAGTDAVVAPADRRAVVGPRSRVGCLPPGVAQEVPGAALRLFDGGVVGAVTAHAVVRLAVRTVQADLDVEVVHGRES